MPITTSKTIDLSSAHYLTIRGLREVTESLAFFWGIPGDPEVSSFRIVRKETHNQTKWGPEQLTELTNHPWCPTAPPYPECGKIRQDMLGKNTEDTRPKTKTTYGCIAQSGSIYNRQDRWIPAWAAPGPRPWLTNCTAHAALSLCALFHSDHFTD